MINFNAPFLENLVSANLYHKRCPNEIRVKGNLVFGSLVLGNLVFGTMFFPNPNAKDSITFRSWIWLFDTWSKEMIRVSWTEVCKKMGAKEANLKLSEGTMTKK